MKLVIMFKIFLFAHVLLIIGIYNASINKIIENQLSFISSSLKNNKISDKVRFQNKDDDKDALDKNILILNSEILNSKPPSDKEEQETQVFPQSANAGTEFIWKYMWWTIMHFPAKNALSGTQTYWLSNRNVQNDHWEAVFEFPQKLDVIDIHWRLPPKKFRVFIKLDDKSEYIPVTEVFKKTSFINNEGKVTSVDAISEFNAVIFNKPLFAKRVRINLMEPVKNHSFSIFSVNFFQKLTTMIIKNELLDETKHYCLFVNTNTPRDGSKVEAYPCIQTIALSNNNEMWNYNIDGSIRHYNSKHCLGFDSENELVLKKCDDYNAAFTVQFRNDNTLFFTGYENRCIMIDESKKISSNLLTDDIEVVATTQADEQTFKKENIKLSGETFWYSTPGQLKATIQIFFGKISNGPFKGNYETKKIDMVKIDWIKVPKKFKVYLWKPGYSWDLVQVYENTKSEISEIEILGQEASALMLILDEAYNYQELGNLPTYAIRHITLTSNSITMKNSYCKDFSTKFKIFDFDTQNYYKLENKKEYEEIRRKISLSYEKNISNYVKLKNALNYVQKAKLKASDLRAKLRNINNIISTQTLKKLTEFKSTILRTIKNSMFENFVRLKNSKDFLDGITNKNSAGNKLGTRDLPAIDCLSIKKLQKNSLSGWYYIKPECAPKPLRVFCDFTIVGDATDIYIFNDDSNETNPDLSYLKIKDFNSIRYQCAKLGLYPLQINNSESVERVYQVLTATGYNLSESIAIPLGYCYSYSNGKCDGLVNSLNDKQTPTISSFFSKTGLKAKSGLSVKSGRFVGLGFSNTYSMLTFDPNFVKISGIICSTNHFKTDSSDYEVKKISCEMSPSSDGNIFSAGGTILIECPPGCQSANTKIYGTNIYHLKSSICKAALHMGVLNPFGGKVNVRIGKSFPKYLGSVANGIESEDFNNNDGMNSFSLQKYSVSCPISQFKDLIIAEGKESLGNDFGTNSSFFQTDTTVEYKLARDKFFSDLNSNELEGVDPDDINKAGVKATNSKIDFSKGANSEDYKYNKIDSSENLQNNSEGEDISGLPKEMVTNIRGMINYNNEHGFPNNNFDFPAIDNTQNEAVNHNIDLFAFSEVDTEEGNINSSDDSLSSADKLKNNRDRIVSEDPNNQGKEKIMKNMFNSIKKATNNVMDMTKKAKPVSDSKNAKLVADVENAISDADKTNMISNSSKNNKEDFNKINDSESSIKNDPDSINKSIDTSIPPPDNLTLPEAPRPPSPPEDKPQIKSNKRKEPSTDEGNKIITKIREAVDFEYLNQVKNKIKKIKEMINSYQKSLAWSKEGSKYSITSLKKKLLLIEKYKTEVLSISSHLSEVSQGRVAKTSKLKEEWVEELNKVESKDEFKIDYSIPAEILFKEIFVPIDTKSKIKSKWRVVKEGIKDKARAIGTNSKIYSNTQLIASILSVNGKDYFDLNLSVDILVKSNGVAGVVFRMQNEYNFYAFSINKTNGTKEIIKVLNGKTIVLKRVSDGGIFINNWHHINIRVNAGSIQVIIYDIEQANKKASEKILEINDDTFVSGGVGLFINNMEGFYFDNLQISSVNCWTPWIPMENIKITTPTSSVYIEDFSGTLSEKFKIVEPDDLTNGPSEWTMNQFYSTNRAVGLIQKSLVYDNSALRRPSMLILKNKIITSGVITVSFTPSVKEGIISIIFKYLLKTNAQGITSEEYYIFEIVGSNTNPQLSLRRFNNGAVREIMSVSKIIKDLPKLGFQISVPHTVKIEIINSTIKIRMSINNSPLVEVINASDKSIQNGLVGIGTFQAKAIFSRLEIFPPVMNISEEEKRKIMQTDSNELFFPALPKIDLKETSNPARKIITNNGKKIKIDTKNSTREIFKLNDGKGKGDNMLIGWKVCLTNITVQQRYGYCERNFPIEITRNDCKNNYCDHCCNMNADKTHKNIFYLCKKTCDKVITSEANKTDYKSVCFQSSNSNNIYDYCENKMKGEPEKKKICKLDMCNLCCSTMDQTQNKQYSVDSMKGCLDDCNKEYNSN